MKVAIAMLTMVALGAVAAVDAAAQNRSVYTGLSTRNCKELRSNPDEGGNYEGECPGVGGYKLRVIEGDLRQTIDVVTPAKRKFPLGFWNVSSAFSRVGERAEWRVRRGVPVALIVRFITNQDPEDANKTQSVLIVSRISRTRACITDVVEPGPRQNANARRLADSSGRKRCMYPSD